MLAGAVIVLQLSFMKPRTPGLWLIPAIIGLPMPSLAFAGMTPEEVKAFEGHKERALKGDLKSHFEVAACYARGWGVAMDQAEALKWVRKAAEQGMLADAYQKGEGVPKDLVEACTLRLLAGPRDAKKAQAMAELQASLTPAELALAQERVQHYRKIIARNEAERGRPKHLR